MAFFWASDFRLYQKSINSGAQKIGQTNFYECCDLAKNISILLNSMSLFPLKN